ncbi:MAG: MarR family transcriptional regulator [Chloroflexi bacterium]|jgi:DNA-binding MarR family transcriptional regulator|nr:MarR family transcriptional regulator [Chloroflexota bacterium]MBT3671233.1 MarR family transcriptional regulator [Chloroflexota bacterium]MBT4003553.1 MarR family transcriptional regulator [Chloroflexota bacterium]MBT4304308.1 MarR family transcriptional regulator [Chloroflexota bacterium]MBT4534327.1 MarR family transcriptional regulator [Chloroflexota bacterium]
MTTNKKSDAYHLASRLQDSMMSLEAKIPEIQFGERRVQPTLNQVRALHLIHENPGIKQIDIAKVLAVTPASISIFIHQISDLGFVKVRKNVEDKRANGLFLSPKGKEIFEEIREAQIRSMEEFLSSVPIDSQKVIIESFEKAIISLKDKQEKK